MPETDHPDTPEDAPAESTPTRTPDGRIAWTPEDAANFIGHAIQEAQRPLTDALRRQGVPRFVFLLVLLMVIAGGYGYWRLGTHQLDQLRRERDALDAERTRLLQQAAAARGAETAGQTRAETLAAEVRHLRGALEKAREDLTHRTAELAATRQVAETAQQQASGLMRRLQKRDAAEHAINTRLGQELAAARQYAEAAKARLKTQTTEVKQLRVRARLAEAQLTGLRAERQALRTQLEALRTALEEMKAWSGHDAIPGEDAPVPDDTQRDANGEAENAIPDAPAPMPFREESATDEEDLGETSTPPRPKADPLPDQTADDLPPTPDADRDEPSAPEHVRDPAQPILPVPSWMRMTAPSANDQEK